MLPQKSGWSGCKISDISTLFSLRFPRTSNLNLRRDKRWLQHGVEERLAKQPRVAILGIFARIVGIGPNRITSRGQLILPLVRSATSANQNVQEENVSKPLERER